MTQGPSSAGDSSALTGIKVVEIASLGPVPFAGMLLADMGADVLRVDRPAGGTVGNWRDGLADHRHDLMGRGKRSIRVDLKSPRGRALLMRLLVDADVLSEGLRPGAMEKLRLGPEDVLEANPRIVYARVSGAGRSGPLTAAAGHDINYLALSGLLSAVGHPDDPPEVPLNVLADFGGGGAFAAMGVCAALVERSSSGLGQVVDQSMLGGTAVLTSMLHGMLAAGKWTPQRHANELDGGAPYYRTYRTADGQFMAVGAVEPQFYAAFLTVLDLAVEDWPQHERGRWPALHEECARRFATADRAHWERVFQGVDACVTPVLQLREAAGNPDIRDMGVFVEHEGVAQPGTFPEFSRTPSRLGSPAPMPGQDTAEVVRSLYPPDEAEDLLASGAVG